MMTDDLAHVDDGTGIANLTGDGEKGEAGKGAKKPGEEEEEGEGDEVEEEEEGDADDDYGVDHYADSDDGGGGDDDDEAVY